MYVFVFLRPLLFPYRGGSMQAVNSECKIYQADFTDWMSLLLKQPSRGVSRKYCFEKHAKYDFCFGTLLKSHFGIGVLQLIYCIFSEHIFLRTPLRSCFCSQHLTSWRKSALRQMSSKKIPQACHQHGITQKIKK